MWSACISTRGLASVGTVLITLIIYCAGLSSNNTFLSYTLYASQHLQLISFSTSRLQFNLEKVNKITTTLSPSLPWLVSSLECWERLEWPNSCWPLKGSKICTVYMTITITIMPRKYGEVNRQHLTPHTFVWGPEKGLSRAKLISQNFL
jgi:hypothetical protein